ncbi:tannase/feruloyl esterase family alpha/beta hydrolase [Burkholderia multivorans]|uniref:tannase/feruloyl esterase family alpha/beta hydrolase n=1 Tax=Burkholderia multivorans TaxID=87883 RepID=UPI0021C02362|nr:tannase/feruloyl esterase family alpha/beta hydrolase [Burkholderia multivorans]
MTTTLKLSFFSAALAICACLPAYAQEASATGAAALHACNVAALSVAAGPGVTLTQVESVRTPVDLCRVRGSVITSGEGAPDGLARFELNLPLNWNKKFLFLGGGGFDGNVPQASVQQLGQGYVTLGTDSGHVQDPRYTPGSDAGNFIGKDGKLDPAVWADYAYRSRTQVNAKVRPMVTHFYGGRAPQQAYFVGCSGGGREALVEAQRNPAAYDGFIAGNPLVDAGTALLMARNFRVLMNAPIPYAKFPAIEQAVLAQCDKLDGVADGLIQNPAACHFDPQPLIKSGVLNAAQGKALSQYLSAPRDTDGHQVGYGSTPSGMGDLSMRLPGMSGGLAGLSTYLTETLPAQPGLHPWGELPNGPIEWLLASGGVSTIGMGKPGLSVLDPSIVTTDGLLRADAVERVSAAWRNALIDPAAMGEFFASGKKLLIYHGYEDSILDPYQTMAMYERLVRTAGGLDKTRQDARLFMVPGMAHCFGGNGPNAFDALGAMEAWAERGTAPDALVAVKFQNNQPGGPIERSMPLCPFPAQARYDGKGDVKQAASWSCRADDMSLLNGDQDGDPAGIGSVIKGFRRR